MDLGLLLLRLLLGLLVMGHGSQKLFGVFGGGGLDGTGAFFEKLGFRPGRPMAALAGLTEFGAGLLVVVGLLTPLAGAGIIGTLLVAGAVNAGKGLWAQQGGYELPLVYAVLGAVLALTGPGSWSIDALLGLDWSLPVSLAAIGLGAVAGLGAAAMRRKASAAS